MSTTAKTATKQTDLINTKLTTSPWVVATRMRGVWRVTYSRDGVAVRGSGVTMLDAIQKAKPIVI